MSVEQGNDVDQQVREAVRAFHQAFQDRDVEAMVAAYALEGQVTAAPGTFRGHEEVRTIVQWAVDTSPVATLRDTGGTVVHGRTAIWEGEITERYGDIDYTYPIVEVYEFDDDLKIARKHNYYDKLAILRQIADRLPGIQGAVYRFLLDRVIDAGETGLTTPRS
jgi:limonene-1,2-epoxide hydrolase